LVFEGKGSATLPILELELGGIQSGLSIFEAFDAKRILHKRFIKQ
jgi:hypothetical protein